MAKGIRDKAVFLNNSMGYPSAYLYSDIAYIGNFDLFPDGGLSIWVKPQDFIGSPIILQKGRTSLGTAEYKLFMSGGNYIFQLGNA